MNNESFKRDDLTRKIVQKAGMEQPSYSFTSKIMERIKLSHSPEVFLYQPVITKRTWMLLGVVIISVLFIFMYMPASQTSAANDYSRYLTPAQNAVDHAASGFFEKLSFLNSLSLVAVALAAGWLLLAVDKVLRKVRLAE